MGLLCLTTTVNIYGQNWDKISKEIKIKQLSVIRNKEYINHYYNLRKKSGYLNRFSPIVNSDTIFIIDYYGHLNHSMLSSIVWNRIDTIICASEDNGQTYNYEKGRLFTKYMIKLVGEWNISEIKREEDINGGSIPQFHDCATRIIFNEKKYKIDCLYFKDFFDINRDRNSFP